MPTIRSRRRRVLAVTALTLTAAVAGIGPGSTALAKRRGCLRRRRLPGAQPDHRRRHQCRQEGTTIAGAAFGPTGTIAVRGRYNQFDVRLADFATLNDAFTGIAGPKDITGARFTPAFASKVPDLRGATLTSAVTISIDKEKIELNRAGSDVS